jgi:hypothetical protein
VLQKITERKPTAAAKSIWPGAAPVGLTLPGRVAVGGAGGLEAIGMGGFPGCFIVTGLLAIGGGGAGFFPIGGGGGFAPAVLEGREAI